MTQDTALDMKDVELNEIDPEKQPMAADIGDPPVAGGGEKNGVVKIKLEDEDNDTRAQKFTGLSKEELLKVAGTPGWVRVRWALLVLFWLGWAGMLAGAVVIIVQAPRCRPLPVTEWWNKGPLYQLGDPETFQDSNNDGIGDIAGVQEKLDYLSALKVKGIVIGPMHVNVANNLAETRLIEIENKYGTLEDFRNLLEAARKKSIQIILDLTPNYQGSDVWFNESETEPESLLMNQIKAAMSFWLDFGLGGIYLNGIENIKNPGEILAELRNFTANYTSDGKARVLLASASDPHSDTVLALFNDTAAGMLTTRYLISKDNSSDNSLGRRIQQYQQPASEQDRLLWAVGPRLGHMASLVHEKLLRVYQLMLFTLQGTPLTLYGDEIGLKDVAPGQAPAKAPYMPWDNSNNQEGRNHDNNNTTVKDQEEDKNSLLNLYKRMSELRGKERSLLHGDFLLLHYSVRSLAYERSWDQNERFVSVLNFDTENEVEVSIRHSHMPEQCTVVLSSNPDRKEGSSLSLIQLKLVPGEALLLKYPYSP